jgi:cytochrome c-type biogenesis protein CcmH
MTMWLAIALMTAAAVFAVLWPLGRPARPQAGSDVAVYKDQLEEIERDLAAGRIGQTEAEAARLEVSRRLLAAAEKSAAEPGAAPAGGGSLWRRRAVAVLALTLLPAGTTALYFSLGSPDLPSQPLAARGGGPLEQRSIAGLVAQVEAHLERNPEDGRGWEVLAPVYMRAGRFEEAVKARRNVIRLLGSNAEREADLGEALVGAANGVVTAEARAAFERVQKLDPADARAQYYLGLAAEQDGRREDAATIWRNLLDRAPKDAPWLSLVQAALARVSQGAARGPSAEDVAAAGQLTPEQRAEMIRGMVEGLAERLKKDGTDLDGWVRLVRAYMVLGERDKARAAAADARRALAGDAEKLKRLDTSLKGLGVEG